MTKCKSCKQEITGNPRFVIKIMSMVGYRNFDFCSRKCFLNHVKKKFKLVEW